MLKVYTAIEDNDIYKAHILIEDLVNKVWCKADNQQCKSKLTSELKDLYENQPWFEKHVRNIYRVCKNLNTNEKKAFKKAFKNNNRIEDLCEGVIKPVDLSTLDKELLKAIKPFFKKLYTQFLEWKTIRDKYGDKKNYYDSLNISNGFKECPCCGYGDLKTIYSKGRSAFDHYLPLKHYPFSSINFNNLVPICTTCNSDEKGEVDVLKKGKPIYYPFAKTHPKIEVIVDVKSKALKKLIEPTNDLKSKITKSEIIVDFNIKDDKTESWDRIFDIKSRYFGKIADNRVGWFKKVDQQYKNYKERINNYSVEDAFEDVIKADSNEHLGFLKVPYLNSLKLNTHLVKAIGEVSGSSIMNS
ncbi:hypothetical protein [uncultured Sunxiuqinia sp.]|uniref:hypothetical protein n=1 Tax=uncultured Sunxiuqinia sp. TaxID=1573825 RepID=UPI002AA72C39|nr:hypothetical protein [uncultured Sunxiuqinia sp.]